MITSHAWFGPRNGHGWGWTPVSWEGGVVVVIFAAVVIGVCLAFGRQRKTGYITIGATAALLVVCPLTGTVPG